MSDIKQLRGDVADLAARIRAVIAEHRTDHSTEATEAKVDLGQVARELERADFFLAQAQKVFQPDRWTEDLQAGAIG